MSSNAVDFGATPDKVFGALDRIRSSPANSSGPVGITSASPVRILVAQLVQGIIDLAVSRKDRFYLYQSRWRPELPMAHLLPHWTWPERVGQVTPVHVFTSGDERTFSQRQLTRTQAKGGVRIPAAMGQGTMAR